MSRQEINPDHFELEPGPDWSSRPWGRPTIHEARSEVSPRFVASIDFKYHGMRVRGIRVYANDNGTLSVNMPQKRFGDVIESVMYFHDPLEREQFMRDAAWLYWSVFGRRRRPQPPQQPRIEDELEADDRALLTA